MKKYKCDRCGRDIKYPLLSKLNLFRFRITILDKYVSKEVNLCQPCLDSLYRWYKMKG